MGQPGQDTAYESCRELQGSSFGELPTMLEWDFSDAAAFNSSLLP